jgi:hypothetical protein
VVGELGTLYSGPSKTEAEVRFGNLARLSDAGDSMDLIRGSDVRLYCDGVLLKEHLGSSRSRTRNAGRPKRRARIAAQWAEVDRLAGVKVPRKRKANGGLSSRWLVFKGGKRPSRAWAPYVLLSTQPEAGGKTRGAHLYCLIDGSNSGLDQWDACSYDSYDEDAREGFSWWGTQVALDDVPEPYRSSILKRAETCDILAAGGTREASSAYASREERLAAMPSYRKRKANGERYRAFDAGPKHEKARRYTVVDTKISMYVPGLGEFYDGEQYGTDYTDGRRIVITARGNGFSTDGLDFGAEIELADVPARYRRAIETFKRGADR